MLAPCCKADSFFSAISFITGLGNMAFQSVLGHHLRVQGQYGNANSTLNGFMPLLGLMPSIATFAVTHYIAHFNACGDMARLQGLLAGCRKFLFRLTLAGSILAVVAAKPLGDFFHYSASLMLVTLGCTLLGLWASLASALCQGLSWFKRLALIGFLGMVLRVLFGWLVTLKWPSPETAVLASTVALLANLFLLFWKKELSLPGRPVSPWNREFVHYLVVSAACVAGGYFFTKGDLLVAHRFFSDTQNDAYNCAELLAAALPITVAPLLTVLFTSRSGARSGNIAPEQLKLLAIYVFTLLFGAGALFLLRGICVKIILGRPSLEAEAMIAPLGLTMTFVGLLQSLALWALASRWSKISLLYGGLGLAYWLGLLVPRQDARRPVANHARRRRTRLCHSAGCLAQNPAPSSVHRPSKMNCFFTLLNHYSLMLSGSKNLPRISIIMPTLNAEAILDNCLASIARQDYPREKIEIILADAHSTDRTRDIAKKYGAIILDDDGKNMEEGKRLALRHATGEFIVFMDADNEITHTDYLALAVNALAKNPQALGVESYYLPSPKMSSFCAYLSHLLHISDPICWLMSANPKLVARDGETERWILPDGTFSYPLGANGFVYRRADLKSVSTDEKFQDTHVALFLMKNGKREWLRIRGRGVHHYYVQTLWGFVKKRRRATVHFLRVQAEMPVNWMEEKPPVPLWLAAVYCVTFLGPLLHTLRGMIRDRDARWLWHLPACLGSVLGNAWGVATCKRRQNNKGTGGQSLIAELQVKQTLKN